MRVADTSALYAFFDESDAHHDAAWDAVSEPIPVLVPSEILVETIGLVTLRAGHSAGQEALATLLRLPHVRIDNVVRIEAVRPVYDAARGKLSLADAYVVQACRALGAKPLTFDREIVKALG